ncbi:methyltransferase, FxLD system [Solwaraspora sp. WMMD1047]|uniref:methyltransferase, FxLD system n=1 Tax=Solwaraspora sp. WMMD1047 TaxID=3016102 RepID=UPI0024163B35|nr:methyltransferase, FxLD system [Solwaraspora sp. WMMD1047]MDG4831563.1 methyltransferase, FxLD system [Solwaraspora sp. WMMD1047]
MGLRSRWARHGPGRSGRKETAMSTNTTGTAPEVLRAQMVERILAGQRLTPAVEAALRQVERHRYVPAAPITDAYNEQAVITHTFPDGAHLSCASGPTIVAGMLDALDVRPGHKIMEIGAGTGYNAALLATLASATGEVTTIDINSDVTAAARRNLDATGYGHVRVITGDGAEGAAEHGPYDRIIVTVGAWDIPHAWWDQLVPGGRLVLPLRWRGTTRAVAFVKRDDHWNSDWVFLCGFVPMLGQPGEQSATIDADRLVTLHYDIDQPIDITALYGVLDRDRLEVWSDASVGGEEPFDRIWLHLSTVHAGTVRIQADQRAVRSGLCTPAIATRSPALVEDGSVAYFTIRRRQESPERWQLGAIGHGPAGEQLAIRVVEQIDAWDRDRAADPHLRAYPTDTPVPSPPAGKLIVKPQIRLYVRYSSAGPALNQGL